MDATTRLAKSPAASQLPSADSKRTISSEFIDELAALDKDEHQDWLEAIKAGQSCEAAHLIVREKYTARFLDIVKRHNEAPVYRVQFPAPHPGEA